MVLFDIRPNLELKFYEERVRELLKIFNIDDNVSFMSRDQGLIKGKISKFPHFGGTIITTDKCRWGVDITLLNKI